MIRRNGIVMMSDGEWCRIRFRLAAWRLAELIFAFDAGLYVMGRLL